MLHGLDRRLDRPVAGDDRDVDVGAQVLHGLHDLDAVHPRHLEVGEDEVVVAALDEPERLRPALDGVDGEAGEHQDLAEAVEHHRLVVDGQDPGPGLAAPPPA